MFFPPFFYWLNKIHLVIFNNFWGKIAAFAKNWPLLKEKWALSTRKMGSYEVCAPQIKTLIKGTDSTFSTLSPEVFNGFRSYSHPISQSGLPFRKKKVYQNRFPFDRVIAILRFSPFRLYLGNDSFDFSHLRT